MRLPDMPHPSTPISHRNAFSLVEVSIALAVVSIALLSVMGLMPVGEHDEKAMDQDGKKRKSSGASPGRRLSLPFDRLDTFASFGPYLFAQDGTLQGMQGGWTRAMR